MATRRISVVFILLLTFIPATFCFDAEKFCDSILTSSPAVNASAADAKRVFHSCHPQKPGAYVRCVALPSVADGKLLRFKVAMADVILCPDGLFFNTELKVRSESK